MTDNEEPYLTDSQRDQLRKKLAKEIALTGTVDGDRFEVILSQILEDAIHIDKKVFFDIQQPHRGIEAKTFKINRVGINEDTTKRNVLKRIPPDGMPDDIMYEGGEDIQIDTSVSPERVGKAVLAYLEHDLIESHAQKLGINGEFDFAVLFRNKDQTQVGYWEETIDFGNGNEFEWKWTDKALVGEKGGEDIFRWYYANQRQLFYYFEAPEDIEIIDLPTYTQYNVDIFTRSEIRELLEESYYLAEEQITDENQEQMTEMIDSLFPKPEGENQSGLEDFN